MRRIPVPDAEIVITEELARSLVRSQFPDAGDLVPGSRTEGWDNVMYRLTGGDAVRLPRRTLGAQLALTELRWLPQLAARWTFPCPAPIAEGVPEGDYPWSWAIVPWFEGDLVSGNPLSHAGAEDLGRALAEVHRPAPAAAAKNPVRSNPLSERVGLFTERTALVAGRIPGLDVRRAQALFDGAEWQSGYWCHLDLHGRNVLSDAGRLAAILDWGDLGVSDPASDLGGAFVMLGPDAFEPFAAAYRHNGGVADPASPSVLAHAVNTAMLHAAMTDSAFTRPGLAALRALGVAPASAVDFEHE